MAVYKTHGLIVKRTNFAEADRLITALTLRDGLTRMIAKGARRPKARITGFVELYYWCLLRCAEGKSIDIVTESTPILRFSNIRKSQDKTNIAHCLVDGVVKLCGYDHKQSNIIRLLVEALNWLDNSESCELLVEMVWLKSLVLAGYRPILDKCVQCHQPISQDNLRFSISMGGLVCESEKVDEDRVEVRVVKLMRLLLDGDFQDLSRLSSIDTATKQLLNNLVVKMMEYRTEKPILNLKF